MGTGFVYMEPAFYACKSCGANVPSDTECPYCKGGLLPAVKTYYPLWHLKQSDTSVEVE